jgi:hypothetical protein
MKRIVLIVLIPLLAIFTYVIYDNSNFLLSDVKPAYEAKKGCVWEEKKYREAELSLFIQICPKSDPVMFFTESKRLLIGKSITNPDYEFTIQVLDKDPSQKPLDVVKQWYNKLTPEQQRLCEIKNVDVTVTYLDDGSVYLHERPNPTAGKTRYAIVPKIETLKSISDSFGGLPNSREFDYMCGTEVGSTLSAYPPYFEFDDSSLDKYLKIGSYAFEAPPIDLNSIYF